MLSSRPCPNLEAFETVKAGNSFPACKIILLVLDENSQPRKAKSTTRRIIGTMAKEVHSKKRKGMLHVLLLLSNCEIYFLKRTDEPLQLQYRKRA